MLLSCFQLSLVLLLTVFRASWAVVSNLHLSTVTCVMTDRVLVCLLYIIHRKIRIYHGERKNRYNRAAEMSRFINQSEDTEHLLLFFVIRLDFRTFLTFYR